MASLIQESTFTVGHFTQPAAAGLTQEQTLNAGEVVRRVAFDDVAIGVDDISVIRWEEAARRTRDYAMLIGKWGGAAIVVEKAITNAIDIVTAWKDYSGR